MRSSWDGDALTLSLPWTRDNQQSGAVILCKCNTVWKKEDEEKERYQRKQNTEKNCSWKAVFWQVPEDSGLAGSVQRLTWTVSWVFGDRGALTFTHPMPTDRIRSSISGRVPDSCTDFTSTWTRRDCPCTTHNFKFLKIGLSSKIWV